MANEIERIKVELPDAELVALADRIVQVIEESKQALAISINETMKTTYWKIGRHIVEFEQHGNARAKYGTALLSNLAKLLRARVGRGYSHPNLNNMRNFYLMYPICQTSEKLTWSHICELVTIDDELEREFYEKECISEGWTAGAVSGGRGEEYLYAEEENVEGDNPPIGIIMSHYKDELMVEYATYGMDSNLFVSKYELFLPNMEELRKMVKTILK